MVTCYRYDVVCMYAGGVPIHNVNVEYCECELALHELVDVDFQQFCSKVVILEFPTSTPSNCDVIAGLLFECLPKPW